MLANWGCVRPTPWCATTHGGARTGGCSRGSGTGTCASSMVASANESGGHSTSTEAVQPHPATYQLGEVQDPGLQSCPAEAHVRDNDVLSGTCPPLANTPGRSAQQSASAGRTHSARGKPGVDRTGRSRMACSNQPMRCVACSTPRV